MILQESISTAIDSIRANLLRSLLTTIAIVIGTASVIAMVGIGSSAQKAIDDSITNVSARTISVYPSRGRGKQKINSSPLSIIVSINLSALLFIVLFDELCFELFRDEGCLEEEPC